MAAPSTCTTVAAVEPLVVTSPDKFPFEIEVAPDHVVRLPEAGLPVTVVQVAQATAPAALSVIGDVAETATVPAAAGRLIVTVPNAPVTGEIVIVPLVAFWKARVPTVEPATPSVGVGVKAAGDPARTSPATPVIEMAPAAEIATGDVPLKPELPTFPIGMPVGKSPVAIARNAGAPAVAKRACVVVVSAEIVEAA